VYGKCVFPANRDYFRIARPRDPELSVETSKVVFCSLLDYSEAEVGRLLVDIFRIALMLICLVAGTLWAQEPHLAKAASQPAKPPRVTSILFSRSSGMCYGYCYAQLEVESGEATLLNHSRDRDKDANKCPDLRVRRDLSSTHWKELVQLVDREALLALPDRIGCPVCVDEVIESLEVRFSNHTKKIVQYNLGSAPKEIQSLSGRLAALLEKLDSELPPTTRCGQ